MYPQLDAHPEIFGDAGTLVSGIESSFIKNGAMPSLTPLEILMGRFPGPMGTTHILVLIVSGICLICRRSVSLSATVGGIAVMGVLSYLTSNVEPAMDAVIFRFVSGFVLFGFIFLASASVYKRRKGAVRHSARSNHGYIQKFRKYRGNIRVLSADSKRSVAVS